MGIFESYQGQTAEYYNAFGIYQLGKSYSYLKERADWESDVRIVWCVLNLFFFIASLPTGGPNIIIYGGLELSYIFNCIAHFVRADGNVATSTSLMKAGGAFGFIASLAGFYMLGHELCRDVLPFRVPVYNTSRLAGRRKSSDQSN
ncbi:hypothetical protein CFAM422_003755 [Trichoderma lentiforme]|uniref:Uncharacterized protein n=1 Tax=Trichoderma lentiforme TaxID=1567552 RepID=A0A9P4XLR2_9HYPO|nr:hypothetical protein CFAM422_003755 [Trichoderma lentiforme]